MDFLSSFSFINFVYFLLVLTYSFKLSTNKTNDKKSNKTTSIFIFAGFCILIRHHGAKKVT